MIIKWTNKFSNETGYVKSIISKEKHFENTNNKSEAKVFSNKGLATSAVKKLTEYGEADNNIFEIIEA